MGVALEHPAVVAEFGRLDFDPRLVVQPREG
jgi:hypothetical protein